MHTQQGYLIDPDIVYIFSSFELLYLCRESKCIHIDLSLFSLSKDDMYTCKKIQPRIRKTSIK